MSKQSPVEWRDLKFGELCQRIVNGGTPATHDSRFWDGQTPWVTGADFTPRGIGEIRRFVSDAGIRASATSVVKAGNLLVVTRTGVGKLAIAPFDIAISQDVTGVYVDGDRAETGFVFYLLSRELNELKKLNQGTSINGIIRADLEKHAVRIPTAKAVQQRIAVILARIDTAIEKTEALIKKYQQIKAGLMHDLFTRGVLPNGQLRPPREQAPELYQETSIGWIPKEWNFGVMDTFADIHNNLRKPLAAEVREKMQGECPYYGPTGILDYINEYLVEGEFCLIGEDGDHFLKFEEWPMTLLVDGRFNVNNHAHLLSGKNGASTKWLHAFFMHRDITFHLTRQGAGRFKLNKAALKKVPLVVPTANEQDEIIKRLNFIRTSIDMQSRQLAKNYNMKLGLMQDLLTGKVQVKVDAPIAETVDA
jgi:type I restriction enzyme, S subunit